MANKPDGKPARVERVTFTRPAAERIAKVVRKVEQGDRGAAGLTFTPRGLGGSPGKTFRICTFTGEWSKSSLKVVTFRGVTATPNTALATNLFASITAASSARNCAIAKDGTAWYLIAAEC